MKGSEEVVDLLGDRLLLSALASDLRLGGRGAEAVEDAGLGPKATTGYRDLDLKLMGKYSEELMDKYTDEEVHPLDVNKDGQLTISEGPSTSEMPKSWQQILGDLLGKG